VSTVDDEADAFVGIFSHFPISLTNCLPEYEQRTLYSALVSTLAILLRLINCRFFIIVVVVIIIIIIICNAKSLYALIS